MDSLTQYDLVRALQQLLPPLDPTAVKFGAVLGNLARHLGVDKSELKAKYKDEIKHIIPDMLHLCKGGDDKENDPENEEDEEEVMPRKAKPAKRARGRRIQESEDEEEEEEEDSNEKSEEEEDDNASGDDSEEEREPKRRKKASPTAKKEKSAPAKRKTPAPRKAVEKSKDSEGMAALKELARVAGLLSPAVYTQLKKLDSEEEQEELLRERLQDAGVRFSAQYPKKNDIAAAKRKRDKEKELDGIDSSLIITGGRSRRSVAQQASYVASYDDEEVEEEIEGDEKNGDEEEELHDQNEEESEAQEEGSEASDESEAEF